MRESAHDPAARRALQAQRQARMIASNAESKIDRGGRATGEAPRRTRAIVFAEHVAMVEAIGRRLAIPTITYRTPPDERRLILDGFRAGRYSKLVAGRVLNEGVDVPDAQRGDRGQRQRGHPRVHPAARSGAAARSRTEAVLYEIISRRTTEGRAARERNPSRSWASRESCHPERSEGSPNPGAQVREMFLCAQHDIQEPLSLPGWPRQTSESM